MILNIQQRWQDGRGVYSPYLGECLPTIQMVGWWRCVFSISRRMFTYYIDGRIVEVCILHIQENVYLYRWQDCGGVYSSYQENVYLYRWQDGGGAYSSYLGECLPTIQMVGWWRCEFSISRRMFTYYIDGRKVEVCILHIQENVLYYRKLHQLVLKNNSIYIILNYIIPDTWCPM